MPRTGPSLGPSSGSGAAAPPRGTPYADEATITCNDSAIASDSAVDFNVWLTQSDGGVIHYASGSDTLAGGEAVLTLKTATAGTYLIEIRRQSGNYASGYVEVEAS